MKATAAGASAAAARKNFIGPSLDGVLGVHELRRDGPWRSGPLDDILALGLPHSLEVKVEHAAGLLGLGDITSACNVLGAFQQEGVMQTGHQLDPALAAVVLPAVQRIGELAGC